MGSYPTLHISFEFFELLNNVKNRLRYLFNVAFLQRIFYKVLILVLKTIFIEWETILLEIQIKKNRVLEKNGGSKEKEKQKKQA